MAGKSRKVAAKKKRRVKRVERKSVPRRKRSPRQISIGGLEVACSDLHFRVSVLEHSGIRPGLEGDVRTLQRQVEGLRGFMESLAAIVGRERYAITTLAPAENPQRLVP